MCRCDSERAWQRTDAQSVSFETLFGGLFTLSTKLIMLNNPVAVYTNLNPGIGTREGVQIYIQTTQSLDRLRNNSRKVNSKFFKLSCIM